MFADNTLDCSQADARSFKLLVTMQALKSSEKFIIISHVDAGSIIFEIVDISLYIINQSTCLQQSNIRIFSKFNGVYQYIGVYLKDTLFIAEALRGRLYFNGHFLPGLITSISSYTSFIKLSILINGIFIDLLRKWDNSSNLSISCPIISVLYLITLNLLRVFSSHFSPCFFRIILKYPAIALSGARK
jgi:hypothetical protein